MAYQAIDGGSAAGRRRYRLLAEMLTTMIAGVMPKPGKAAIEAYREWGRYLYRAATPLPAAGSGRGHREADRHPGGDRSPPEAVAEGTRYQLRLRQCPFREVAQNHQEVVCSLHLGLMQGALAQMRAPVTADRLQPFAEPGLCIASLTARTPPEGTRKAPA